MILPVIAGTAYGSVVYYFMGPKEQIDNVLRNLMLTELDLVFEDITYIGPRCYYKTGNNEERIDTEAVFSVTFCLMVMVFSLLCMAYFATKTFFKIRKTLKTSTTRSRKFNRLQSQAFYALVAQTLIPVILLHFPCSSVLIAALLNIDLGHLSGVTSVTFALFPALDPIPVMLIIQSYRGALLRSMSCFLQIFIRRSIRSSSSHDGGQPT